MQLVRKILLFIPLLLLFNSVHSQQEFTDDKRVEYLLSIPKYISWQKETNIDTLVFAILDSSKAFYNYFADTAQKSTIKGKPVRSKYLYSTFNVSDCNVLYVKRGNGFEVQDVVSSVKGKKILLITENFSFNSSMVNFIVYEGKRSFELNTERLTEEGFVVNPLFAAMAVTREADWQLLYMKSEDLLGVEKQKVAEQKEIITVQESKLIEQEAEISQLETEIDEKLVILYKLSSEVKNKIAEIGNKNIILQKQEEDLKKQKEKAKLQTQEIEKSKDFLDKLKLQSVKLKQELTYNISLVETQKYIIYLFILVLFLISVAAYFVFNAFRIKKKANRTLAEKNKEILAQNEEISTQRDHIAKQNEEITDSILYASRIQQAILPPEEFLKNELIDHFILYKPRDIVSGDYYWYTQNDDLIIAIAADSTGHGVPGAFMSIMGVSFLNEIVNHEHNFMPHEILNRLRLRIVEALNQGGKKETKDGMDMTAAVIDKKNNKLYVSGAYNSLFFIRDNNLEVLKADKMPVGLSDKLDISFTLHEVEIETNDTFYMFSDGYADQFGGDKGKKFMSKRFKELLISINSKPMEEQKRLLNKAIEEWMNGTEQIDDILVFGVKVCKTCGLNS